jgi:hypothetical protein
MSVSNHSPQNQIFVHIYPQLMKRRNNSPAKHVVWSLGINVVLNVICFNNIQIIKSRLIQTRLYFNELGILIFRIVN